jgi:hypothetical protein
MGMKLYPYPYRWVLVPTGDPMGRSNINKIFTILLSPIAYWDLGPTILVTLIWGDKGIIAKAKLQE